MCVTSHWPSPSLRCTPKFLPVVDMRVAFWVHIVRDGINNASKLTNKKVVESGGKTNPPPPHNSKITIYPSFIWLSWRDLIRLRRDWGASDRRQHGTRYFLSFMTKHKMKLNSVVSNLQTSSIILLYHVTMASPCVGPTLTPHVHCNPSCIRQTSGNGSSARTGGWAEVLGWQCQGTVPIKQPVRDLVV